MGVGVSHVREAKGAQGPDAGLQPSHALLPSLGGTRQAWNVLSIPSRLEMERDNPLFSPPHHRSYLEEKSV